MGVEVGSKVAVGEGAVAVTTGDVAVGDSSVAVGAGAVAVGEEVEVGGDVGVASSPVHAANKNVAIRVRIRAGLRDLFGAVIVLLNATGIRDKRVLSRFFPARIWNRIYIRWLQGDGFFFCFLRRMRAASLLRPMPTGDVPAAIRAGMCGGFPW